MQSLNMGAQSMTSSAPVVQNTPQQIEQPQQQPQDPRMNQQNQAQVQRQPQTAQSNRMSSVAAKQLEKMNKLSRQFDQIPTFERSSVLDRKAPAFPESAFARLSSMMSSNQQLRDGASQQLSRQLSDMKEKFFESYSYKTEQGADGKPKLVYDAQGRPTLMNGKEQFQQRIARQEHEATTKQAYSDYHSSVKESFLNGEKHQVQSFLQAHRHELGNPAVQQELQKMLAESEKKGLKLKRELDDQMWELDLPSEEMRDVAKKEAKKLRQMEDEHKKMEDSSAEAHELIMYQEEMNALAIEEKQKLQFSEKDEAFLQGANSMLKPPAPPSLAELLPPYLVNSLYSMGIYAID